MDDDDDGVGMPAMKKGKKVLFAMDGSKYSVEAFEWYVEHLHKSLDTVIFAYSADHDHYLSGPSTADDDSAFDSPENQTKKVFRAIDEIANRHRVKHILQLLHEPLGDSVLKCVTQQGVDMIIIGGRRHGKSTDMGATTNFVAALSDVPVLVYKYVDDTKDDRKGRHRTESFSDKMKAILKIS